MDITADAPLTPRGEGPPAFRDVAWTPRDVLFGALWFVGLFVGAQIAILPLAFAFGVKSGQLYSERRADMRRFA